VPAPDQTSHTPGANAPAGILPSGHRELLAAFWCYETALMANDVAALDDLFADGAGTIRSDERGALVGHDHIAEFRRARGGAPDRRLLRVHVREAGPGQALVVAEAGRTGPVTSVQTQLWRHADGAWRITAAHVSASAPASPAPASSPGELAAAWRVAPGTQPLVPPGSRSGPLAGVRVAVKDLFAVAGHKIGAGNPAWLRRAETETASAAVVEALQNAGALISGIAHTDELAFALAGANIHYGTARNPAAPGRVPGGSSSGPAAAVAAGEADLGLGTDTAGSVRVPASYQGLYGLRTTRGAISTAGMVGLAESFDAIGFLARDPALLDAAARAVLSPAATSGEPARFLLIPQLTRHLGEDTLNATTAAATALALRTGLAIEEVHPPWPSDDWLPAFRTVQAAEAWRRHGDFVTRHPQALAPEIAERFRAGSRITTETETAARGVLLDARQKLAGTLTSRILLLPSASGAAYPRDAAPGEAEHERQATLRLTCLASLAGLPALSVPLARLGTLPLGLCLVGAPGTDLILTALAARHATRQP
jgi:Asp-tRNA(Asn)/Glu-tRNA(Gln) amidotransferase A subunit family amidase